MIAGLGLPQSGVDALARIVLHAARTRTTTVDLRVIFGEPPPGSVWCYELTEEGIRRFMAARPAFAPECRLLLRIHAAKRGLGAVGQA